RCLSCAFAAHLLRNAFDQPFRNSARGFGSDIARRDSRSADGNHQTRYFTAFDHPRRDKVFLIRNDGRMNHPKPGGFKLPDYGWTGNILAFALERRIADGEHGGGFHRFTLRERFLRYPGWLHPAGAGFPAASLAWTGSQSAPGWSP